MQMHIKIHTYTRTRARKRVSGRQAHALTHALTHLNAYDTYIHTYLVKIAILKHRHKNMPETRVGALPLLHQFQELVPANNPASRDRA